MDQSKPKWTEQTKQIKVDHDRPNRPKQIEINLMN